MDFEFGEVESVEKVPEQFRHLYKQGEGGKFGVDPTHKGVAEAIVGLNRSLKAARLESKNKPTVDLSPLAEFGSTPEEIKTKFQTKVQELQEALTKGGDAKFNLEKIKKELAEGHAAELTKHTKRIEALQTQLYDRLVTSEAVTAIAEMKGVAELLLPFVRNQVKVLEEDGKMNVFVVDAQGDRRYSGVTGQPMSVKELIAEMKGNEKYGRLFESENDKGGGGAQQRGVKQVVKNNNQQRELSAVEKISKGLGANQHKQTRGLPNQ